MKEKLKQTKGITLIALIITIIILLILAVVSIRLIINQGILNKSKDAVDEYSKAEADEQAKLLQAEYEMAKYEGKFSGSYDEYIIKKNYGQDMKIGDIVKYDAKSNGEKTYTPKTENGAGSSAKYNSTTKKYDLTTKEYKTEDLTWKVLGVNSKGQIELIGEQTSEMLVLANAEGYIHGKDELDIFCRELYGQGVHAVEARSVTVDDINKITGYDPAMDSGYGTEYEYISGTFIIDGNILAASDNDKIKLKSDYYRYSGNSKLSESSKEYTMLFENSYYWLATTAFKPYFSSSGSVFSMQYVSSGTINGSSMGYGMLYCSDGSSEYDMYRVRAVVSLESDIQFSGSSTDGWTIE